LVPGDLTRDRVGVLAALAVPLVLAAVLVRFWGSFPNTDAALAMLLAIGVAVTEISVVGRRQHAAASRRAGYVDSICGAAHTVVAVTSPSVAIDQVAGRLAQLLLLRPCRFRYSVAGFSQPARLRHHGMVRAAGWPWDADADGLTAGAGVELLAERGGIFRGRVLLSPFVGAHPMHGHRLPAVAFAGQAGAAPGASRPVEEA
jgi:hypothetical protein